VRAALELVEAGKYAEAQERVKSISRGSAYADWRLFIRGLAAFYQQDLAAARQNWQRLDRTRRPARMANVLLLAEDTDPLHADMWQPPQKKTRDAQELLQRPKLLANARRIASTRSKHPDETLSPEQFRLLMELREKHRKLDPAFVDYFSQACVRLAAHQPAEDCFEFVTSVIPGPPDDPNWTWLTCTFYYQFSGDTIPIRSLATRLHKELESRPDGKLLAGALESLLYLRCARDINAEDRRYAMLNWDWEPADSKELEDTLMSAIKAYPANRDAHRELIAHLENLTDYPGVTRSQLKMIEAKLLKAKQAFVKACPDEVELSLELIDHYFESGNVKEAKKLAATLTQQRLDDPLARAIPWKLKMHEIMQASRRKTLLQNCREMLDEAQQLWPTWLTQHWLGFLRAALELRAGDAAQFESLLKEARDGVESSELLVDVMTFARTPVRQSAEP
jgi:hypothetical protein